MWLFLATVSLVIPLGLDLYMPVPEENPLTSEKIELGRRLFNDRRLSRDGSIACSSCHEPERAFSDGRTVPVGVFGCQGHRNAPALINRGYGRTFFWDARSPPLEDQVLKPIQDPNEMDLTLDDAATRVGSRFRARFVKVSREVKLAAKRRRRTCFHASGLSAVPPATVFCQRS